MPVHVHGSVHVHVPGVCVSTCRMYLYIYIYRTIGINHKNIMMHIYTIRIIICVFYTKCTFYCTVQSSLHRSPCLPGNGRIASMSFFWWPPVHIITFGPSLDWVIWIVCLVFQSIRLDFILYSIHFLSGHRLLLRLLGLIILMITVLWLLFHLRCLLRAGRRPRILTRLTRSGCSRKCTHNGSSGIEVHCARSQKLVLPFAKTP